MPGGSPKAWPLVKPIFQSIAARAGDPPQPCCDWVGENGAGHYVKMVHNGIEYGDMQLIGEAYHIMKEGLGMGADEMAAVFADWNKGKLDSYLIEITANILAYKDSDGQHAGGQDPRQRRAERHRKMDRHIRARDGHSPVVDRGGRAQPRAIRSER